jgi:hypothetical protein
MGEFQHAIVRELKSEAARETRLARIEELENELMEKASSVLSDYLSFREIRHDQAEPPPEWVEELGRDEAERKLNIAKAAWLPASLAPAGATLAARMVAGISRGRNYRVKMTQNNLNVKIALPAPTSSVHPGPVTYEVRDLET